MNDIVATPRLVKIEAGKLPVGVFMPMTSGNGPFPLGNVIVLLNVMLAEPCVTTTVNFPPEKVAVRLLGGAPFGPDTQCCICELISARRHLQPSRVEIRLPLVIRNGSGKFGIACSAPNAGGAGGGAQSAPVFSVGYTNGMSPDPTVPPKPVEPPIVPVPPVVPLLPPLAVAPPEAFPPLELLAPPFVLPPLELPPLEFAFPPLAVMPPAELPPDGEPVPPVVELEPAAGDPPCAEAPPKDAPPDGCIPPEFTAPPCACVAPPNPPPPAFPPLSDGSLGLNAEQPNPLVTAAIKMGEIDLGQNEPNDDDTGSRDQDNDNNFMRPSKISSFQGQSSTRATHRADSSTCAPRNAHVPNRVNRQC
ncbi:MAG: hypothetical protein ACOY0T_21145 [Myxococcota bacterium]